MALSWRAENDREVSQIVQRAERARKSRVRGELAREERQAKDARDRAVRAASGSPNRNKLVAAADAELREKKRDIKRRRDTLLR